VKIALLGGDPVYITRFRGHLLRALKERGHTVVAWGGAPDASVARELAAAGIGFESFPFDRTGARPDRELRTVLTLRDLLRRERPDLLIATTPKLIGYGSIAARWAGTPRSVALVTGLGMAFDTPQRLAEDVYRHCAQIILKLALRNSSLVVFYNPDDREELLRLGVLPHTQATLLLNGSGVDVEHFSASAVPSQPVTFLLLGRLLRSKGVLDFVAAARTLKVQHPSARFQLLGDLDARHPHSIGAAKLDEAQHSGIEYLGAHADVRPYLNAATVVVVPSQQREGLPRVILEAFATGRPVLASDVPGCRHAVSPNRTGWLVPPRSPDELQAAMLSVIEQPQRAVSMGASCRLQAEQRFAVERITAQLIQAIEA
jgi:glycosyltransferase involved in cell wall biosynthesis